MSRNRYRIDPERPIGASLQLVTLTELTLASQALANDVHQMRRHGKKLRAMLRLVRPALEQDFRILDRQVRDASRLMAGARRTEALRELCGRLQQDFPEDGWQRVMRQLPAPAPSGADTAQAAHLLHQVSVQVHSWATTRIAVPEVARGLQKTYRDSRRLARRCARKGTDTLLHEWRKQVKHHRHQCELMAPLWPGLGRRLDRLKRLSDLLGRHQDLSDLAALLEQAPARYGDNLWVAQRLERIHALQKTLATRALRRRDSLFAEKPKPWRRAMTR